MTVRDEAATLRETLDRTRNWYDGVEPKPVDPDQFQTVTHAIEGDLKEAVQATEPKPFAEVIATWWTGSAIETAWTALHRAAESLLLVESPDDVRAQFPDMEWQIRATFADGDTRKNAFLNDLKKEEAKAADNALDRAGLSAMRRVRDQVWDTAHAQQRQFRNILFRLTLAVAVVVGVIVILSLGRGLVPVCSGSKTQPTICPSAANVAGWRDVLAIATLGAFGGLLAAAVSLRRVHQTGGEYNVTVAQAMLKVPTGAATGILGSVLIANQVLGIKVTPGTGQLAAYAVLFGYAQQAFTRYVEARANTLLAATPGSKPPGSES